MIIDALRKKYQADIAAAKANIDVYQKNPAGIGEHPDLVAAVDSEMTKMANARDKLDTLNTFYSADEKELIVHNDEIEKVLLAENEE